MQHREKELKKVSKIRTILISEMKTTTFYTVAFLAFLLANSSNVVSFFHLSVVTL